MFNIHVVSCVLVVFVAGIHAQSCKTPNNVDGQCVGLYSCDSVLDIVNKQDKAREDFTFLRQSQCGLLPNKEPKVCCPPTNCCVTPEDQPGRCIGLYDCPHVADLLRDKNNIENVNYVKKSVCQGPEQHSVCCGPAPPTTAAPTPDSPFLAKCARSVTAFPPARSTHCCGRDASSSNKIVGGVEVWIDEYPWLVIIEYLYLNSIRLLCGGTLISGKYVLTAGHCVVGRIQNEGIPTNVRLGDYNITSNGRDCKDIGAGGMDCTDPVIIVPIEKITPHPDYRPYSYQRWHDIALIRLRDVAPYTDFIRPICLPSMDYSISQPTPFQLFAAGWGRYIQMENGKGIPSDVKRHVELPYVQRNPCQAAQRTLYKADNITLRNGQICAGGETGKDSCKGDSGGPLMYKDHRTFEIVGVVSYGPAECGQRDIPGVYTYIYDYLPWITSVIEA